MSATLRHYVPWFLWLSLTAAIALSLFHAMNADGSAEVFLPGHSTDGHYQIEMACTACHDNEAKDGIFTSEGVTNKACNACHGEDLEKFSDSHPTRKFKNPENAVFLQHVDAMRCTACHTEHRLDRTRPMGVTIPENFCAHCHEVTLENRESHRDLPFNTCATAGCHNYHDNVALAPSFMTKRYGQPDHITGATVVETDALVRWLEEGNERRQPLTLASADAPSEHCQDPKILNDWHSDAHSAAGVNCMDCHSTSEDPSSWVAKPDHTSCQTCHEAEVTTFLKGKHGMRLAHSGIGAMIVGEARLPMKSSAAHESLSCSSCHSPHNYDRFYASHQACIQCHDDEHTRNYEKSSHYQLWQAELAGGPVGSGVSCATCHMPREEHGNGVLVNHNQNANLTPNEKMLQSVCMTCHGMEFGLSALADRELIEKNFHGTPSQKHPGMDWAVKDALADEDEEVRAIHDYLQSLPQKPTHGPRNPLPEPSDPSP